MAAAGAAAERVECGEVERDGGADASAEGEGDDLMPRNLSVACDALVEISDQRGCQAVAWCASHHHQA